MYARWWVPLFGGVVLVLVGACGDETSPFEYPVPVLDSIEPDRVGVWGSPIWVRLLGREFADIAQVHVDGEARVSRRIDRGTLELRLEPADLGTFATRRVQVFNPPPGGGASGVVSIEIVARDTHPPAWLARIEPSQVLATSDSVTFTLHGGQIMPGAHVWLVDTADPNFPFHVVEGEFVSIWEMRFALGREILGWGRTFGVRVSNTLVIHGPALSEMRTLQILNPAPAVTSVLPARLRAGTESPKLALTGEGFTAATVVQVNARDRPVTWIDSRNLAVDLADEDVREAGELRVSVANPEPGGGTAQALAEVFAEVPLLHRLPVSGAVRGTASAEIRVYGEHFTPSSVVRVDGSTRPTRYVGPTRLAAELDVPDLAVVRTLGISVETPNVGSTPALPFTVVADEPFALVSHVVVALPARDLHWVEATGRLYASVGDPHGHGGAIHEIDPATGAILASVPVDGGPDRLVASTDGSVLWVALDSIGAILPLRLPSLIPEAPFSPDGYHTADIAPLPGSPRSVAVGFGDYGTDVVRIYDEGRARPLGGRANFDEQPVAFSEDGSRLFAYGRGRGPVVYRVHAGGLEIESSIEDYWANEVEASYVDGLMAHTWGTVWDAFTHEVLGQVGTAGNIGGHIFSVAVQLVPSSGNALVLDEDRLELWDLYSWRHLASVTVPSAAWRRHPIQPRLVPWGVDGLAFSDRKRVHILRLTGVGR